MRYVGQPDRISCGPTAILNAMKWAGIDATLRGFLPYLQFSCRTIDLANPDDFDASGTTDSDFDRVLRYVGQGAYVVKRRKHPSYASVEAHLRAGGAAALSYHWTNGGQSGDHFCFLADFSQGCFVCVNDHLSPGDGVVQLRKPETMKTWLKRSADAPTVWFLTLAK